MSEVSGTWVLVDTEADDATQAFLSPGLRSDVWTTSACPVSSTSQVRPVAVLILNLLTSVRLSIYLQT